MRCTVFGTGYLGATHAAGMAELGTPKSLWTTAIASTPTAGPLPGGGF